MESEYDQHSYREGCLAISMMINQHRPHKCGQLLFVTMYGYEKQLLEKEKLLDTL